MDKYEYDYKLLLINMSIIIIKIIKYSQNLHKN